MDHRHPFLDYATIIGFTYTVSVVLVCWEVAARSIVYFYKRQGLSSDKDLFIISIKSILVVLPFVILFSFINNEYVEPYCFPNYESSMQKLVIISLQGFVLSQIIILYEIFKLYIAYSVRTAREKEQIKKELIAAKYEGLKNQINPHFLFNSFSVLSSLVERDSEIAVKFISKLSDMYRYILENDEKSLVSLEEEIDFLNDYLFLVKMRHQSAIEVDMKIEAADMNTKIPPMSLQILVENAVKHNSFSKEDPLKIRIDSSNPNSIQVSNKKVKKEELIRSTGIGLSNLSKRLKLLVGRGLTIVEDDNMFKVSVPLQ